MVGGESSYALFGYETTFKTAVTANKPFGWDTRITRAGGSNAIRRVFNLGNRSAQKLLEAQFAGSLSVDFELADPWFLKGVLGSLSTAGAGPYTHTITEIAAAAPSLTVEAGIDLATDAVIKYLGCVVSSCRLAIAAPGDPVRVTLDMLYATESKATSGLGSQTAPTDSPFNFAYATLEMPNGTTIANTQSVDLTITNTSALRYAIGSRFAAGYTMRQRIYDINTTNLFTDAAIYLETLYGSAAGPMALLTEVADLEFVLDNGQGTTARRAYNFYYSGVKIDSHDLPRSIDSELYERVPMIGRTLSVTAVDNTSAMP